MAEIKAGVVVVTKFCKPQNEKFQKYIDYIERDDATRTVHNSEYNLFMEYMDNPQKTTGLFTAGKDNLDIREKKALKKEFQKAQNNKSIMWQTVISFDNRWLAENGLYNPETKILDESKLKEVGRNAITKMLKNEGLENALWSASIHYNTDNIHIHIATVEPEPMREKKEYTQYQIIEKDGKEIKEPILDAAGNPVKKEEYVGRFKQKSIEACKSVVVNQILNEKENNIKINRIIRESILKQKRDFSLAEDPKLKAEFLKVYQQLPDVQRSLWNYNSNVMHGIRPEIDRLSRHYLEIYHEKEFSEFKNMIKIQELKYRKAYGDSGREYANTKMQDLYVRLGNAILKEMREYDKAMKDLETAERMNRNAGMKETDKEFQKNRRKRANQVRKGWTFNFSLKKMKKALKSEWEKTLNQREHEQFQELSEERST